VGTIKGEVLRMEKDGLEFGKDVLNASEEYCFVKQFVTSGIVVKIGVITGVSWGDGS